MYVKKLFLLIYIITIFLFYSVTYSLSVLHISFHKGCINEINFVAQQLNLNVTSLFIPDLPAYTWDGYATGNALYNVGYERAQSIWNKHKDYFNQFDVVITSDTAPLSRIFLQNHYQKPVIIWICNRFDYADYGSLDCLFPDKDYYELLKQASSQKNIHLVPYNAFESLYAAQKNIICGNMIIKPVGLCSPSTGLSSIPDHIIKEKTFFIPPYLNDASVNLVDQCAQLAIPVYRGRYNGSYDLKDFKGIIHIPYAWSNVAFFENIQHGLPYFVPSAKFIRDLYDQGMIWWQNGNFFKEHYCISEWYNEDNKDIITYFDSWQDLKDKIETINFDALRLKVKEFAHNHLCTMLQRWRSIFDQIAQEKNNT